jgi:hypothetical protein|tara:strand:+ start:67 stop:1065 length:999 start_codon:yes stop_codon:yes gene_type:complete
MATYKGIQGYTVQKLATDPTASEAAGQLWYNSTSGAFKISTEGAGAWSSGGALNTPRNGSGGAGVSNTSALCFGGTTGPTLQNQTELYDGSSWTEVNNLNTTRYSLGGLGTVTAAMGISGYADANPLPAAIETYNGTSWTTSPVSMPYAAINVGQGGTTTAAVVWGGQAPPAWVMMDNTLIWNGSTWTEVADVAAAAWANGTGFGTSTAALAAGSRQPSLTANTELWNGTSWSEVNNMNTARFTTNGCGTTTAGMVNGGQEPAISAKTELWDGTSWTEVADLAQGRYDQGEGPNCPSGNSVIWGGSATGSPYSNICEEWNDPVYTIKTVTVS